MNEILGSTVWLAVRLFLQTWLRVVHQLYPLYSFNQIFCYLNFGRLKQVLNKVHREKNIYRMLPGCRPNCSKKHICSKNRYRVLPFLLVSTQEKWDWRNIVRFYVLEQILLSMSLKSFQLPWSTKLKFWQEQRCESSFHCVWYCGTQYIDTTLWAAP